MIEQRGSDIIFKDRGYPLGIVTDGDELDRPEGSLEDLTNMDYDIETGKLRTRNSTSDETTGTGKLLNGFSMPAGYSIMVGGLKLFSFNNPVDREVCLLFVQNASKDVRIYVNTWFNPPVTSSTNDYENYVSSLPDGWSDGWVEITEQRLVHGTVIAPGTVVVTDTDLNNNTNYYRGWFLWNATHWNAGTLTDLRKNESFACIESYDVATKTFTVQSRPVGTLTTFGWANGDIIYLIRYPIMVHKAKSTDTARGVELLLNFTPIGDKWVLKTNVSIEILIGQEGNLWFGFLNKDITKIPAGSSFPSVNINRYYGWWLDYETPPIVTKRDGFTGAGNIVIDSKIGLRLVVSSSTATGSTVNMIGAEVIYNDRHRIAVFKGYNNTITTADQAWIISPQCYHQYSRRITGADIYGKKATSDKDEPVGFLQGYFKPYLRPGTGDFKYSPVYNINLTDTFVVSDPTPTTADNQPNGKTLVERIIYSIDESISVKTTAGTYAQGRNFQIGDEDYPDTVRYSLYNREDIFALQDQRPVDATDRDKNTAIDLLGINPVVFKNRSIHIANIEGETEVGWRLIETKSRVGCPYPRSIARTNYGLTFANDEGYWLLADAGEPINLLRKRRLQAYLALTTRAGIFAEWYGKHSEVWIYVGNKTFWVCKLNSEEKMIGFKIYTFNFTPIDLTIDDNGDLFIVGNDFAYKYNNDDEITDGKDADNTNIVWSYTPNYNTFGRYAPFHHIESIINFKGTNRDGSIPEGSEETINITVYREANEIIQTKTIAYDVATSPESLVIKNNKSDRQRALKIKVNGTLTFLKRLEITEVNSRVKGAVKQVKSGYKEAV